MRKLILIFCICSSAMSTYSQVWKNVNIDSGICVSLPENYKKTDSLKQYSITARAGFGNILITRIPDNPVVTPDIYKKRHLDRYYSNYIQGIKASSKGSSISDEKDTVIGKLRVRDFTLHIDNYGVKKARKFRVLHENSATYTFQFLYDEATGEFAKPEIDKFFSSVAIIRDLDLESQFTKMKAGQKRTFFSGRNIAYGAGILVLLGLIVYLVRRRGRS